MRLERWNTSPAGRARTRSAPNATTSTFEPPVVEVRFCRSRRRWGTGARRSKSRRMRLLLERRGEGTVPAPARVVRVLRRLAADLSRTAFVAARLAARLGEEAGEVSAEEGRDQRATKTAELTTDNPRSLFFPAGLGTPGATNAGGFDGEPEPSRRSRSPALELVAPKERRSVEPTLRQRRQGRERPLARPCWRPSSRCAKASRPQGQAGGRRIPVQPAAASLPSSETASAPRCAHPIQRPGFAGNPRCC